MVRLAPTTVALVASLGLSTAFQGPGVGRGSAGFRQGSVVTWGALPPEDSPYKQPEEERPFWGKDYEPMPDWPGTMPPGTRPENAPIETLPESSRIPFPHFQVWPFHFR
jgi:hypothetical protein